MINTLFAMVVAVILATKQPNCWNSGITEWQQISRNITFIHRVGKHSCKSRKYVLAILWVSSLYTYSQYGYRKPLATTWVKLSTTQILFCHQAIPEQVSDSSDLVGGVNLMNFTVLYKKGFIAVSFSLFFHFLN